MADTTAIQSLPRVLYVKHRTDAGEFGAATCPHCGADGRYVIHFVCEGGIERAAMAGCFKLFPKSALADESLKILERKADREKQGRSLASWDLRKWEAIEQVAAGTMTVDEAQRIIRAENLRRREWLDRNNYGRGR